MAGRGTDAAPGHDPFSTNGGGKDMHRTPQITRRQFTLGSLAAFMLPLAGCSLSSEIPQDLPTYDESEKSARGFVEPPFLRERVKAGTLPPIDERLPEDCFVVGSGTLLQPRYATWRDGRYGGTIRNTPTSPTGNLNLATGSTILRSPSQTTDQSMPNVVSAFEPSPDMRTFAFTLRKGLRWSDGEKVTTEDVRFLVEDLYQHPDSNTPFPTDLFTQRDTRLAPATLRVIDELRFELEFAAPYGQFVAALHSWIPTVSMLFVPAHHLKRYHGDYADPAALQQELDAAGASSWGELMTMKNLPSWSSGEADALGLPVLNAWVLTEVKETTRVFERNPYFWHVDASGHQLPYADSVVNYLVVDDDALLRAVMDGQVTVAAGDNVTLNNMAVYTQSGEHADTRVFLTNSFNFPPLLFLNHDYRHDAPDDPWQQLVADPDARFGRALSLAIDPEAINRSVYFGLHGEPMLNSAEHDPEKARTLLDQVGMDQVDDKGYRLGPDGASFTFAITFPTIALDFAPVAELVRSQLEDVGLRVTIKGVDDGLFGQLVSDNAVMASIHWNDGAGWSTGISNDYMPNEKGAWSPETWAYVQSKGEQGRKPPPYVQEFYDIASRRTEHPPASPEGKAAYERLMEWLTGHYAFIPTTGLRVKPNVVKNGVANLPDAGAPFELDTILNLEGIWFER